MADEKSVHIHEMIMQQKKPKTKNKQNKNRSKSNTYISTSNKYNHNMQRVVTTGHQLSPFQSVNRQHAVRTAKLNSAPPLLINNFNDKIDSNHQVLYTLPQPSGITSIDAHRSKPLKANNNLQKREDIDKVSNLIKSNHVTTQSSPSPQSSGIVSKDAHRSECLQPNKLQKCEGIDKVSNLINSNLVTTQLSLSPSAAPLPPPLVKKENKFYNDTNENVNDLNKDYPIQRTSPVTVSTKTKILLENIKPPITKQKSLARIEKLASMRKHINFSNSVQEHATSSTTSTEVEKKDSQKPTETVDLKLTKERNKLFDVNKENDAQSDEAVPAFAAVSRILDY